MNTLLSKPNFYDILILSCEKMTLMIHWSWLFPPQGNIISGKNGRIHCSLNINTETGRLSARRPNLQVSFTT